MEHHQTTIYYAQLDPAAARLTHVSTSERSSETDRTPHNPQLCIRPALSSDQHNRSNYLFVGSDSGGERAAAMYSLIGSAKLTDQPARLYGYVLIHIADYKISRIDELLPWNVADKLKPATPPTPLTG